MAILTILVYLLSMLCGRVIAGSLSMDEAGYCGEHKEAVYNGTGRSVTITIDEEDNPVIITSNTEDPKCLGGFQFKLLDATPISDQPYSLLIFTISIVYNVSSQTSGQTLRFSTTAVDQVSGKTLIQSCSGCSLPIIIRTMNMNLTVSWQHVMCCGWDGDEEYTVALECLDCGPTLNESLITATRSTSATFWGLPTGMYRASLSTRNKCGQIVSNYTVANHFAETYNHAIPNSTGHTLLMMAMAAVVLLYIFFN